MGRRMQAAFCITCGQEIPRKGGRIPLYCCLYCAWWPRIAPPDENGCCKWLGSLTSSGYPTFGFRRQWYSAVEVCRRFHGLYTNPRLDIMHSCNVRRCVTLEHILEQGTRRWNMQQSKTVGRYIRTIENRKLSSESTLRRWRAYK